ncbi:Hsp20/alpha crystallin family protein [Leptolyngbya cf. ectocarpi LEGE 11479]|uniref:Hsp20/alpha crystallin family protein n=1 Tax=Leptolyngbya cf. ectocarpi LEGE 11479 TaxID=1828722 RepID=A0A929A043_LEPEC|nr:Hsp20/alpha crystallin family protein [Leptolyngbya ectocarpi]MBE9070712.1 Hsp20/alpha crystallin family protein [Leptolyngbya cf. ectocarpi LEGE 11479]
MTLRHWQPFRQIEQWEPFSEMETLRKELDKLFNQFTPRLQADGSFTFMPSAEMDETDAEIHLKFEVPGMTANDLSIEVTDSAVVIRGERKSETKTEEDNITRSEFQYGKFERVVPLPSHIVKDDVSAEYSHGILRLVLPKSEGQTTKTVKIKAVE